MSYINLVKYKLLNIIVCPSWVEQGLDRNQSMSSEWYEGFSGHLLTLKAQISTCTRGLNESLVLVPRFFFQKLLCELTAQTQTSLRSCNCADLFESLLIAICAKKILDMSLLIFHFCSTHNENTFMQSHLKCFIFVLLIPHLFSLKRRLWFKILQFIIK